MRTKIIFLTILFFFQIFFSLGQWVQLNSGTTNYLTSCFFLNKDTGVVVGEKGTILKTMDGGNTWSVKTSADSGIYYQVYFYDSLNGVIATNNANVLITVDGGETWTVKQTGFNKSLFTVIQLHPDTIIAGGSDPSIVKSNDGGDTWDSINVPFPSGGTSYINDITFYGNIGYAAATFQFYNGIILKTENRGETWNVVLGDTITSLVSVKTLDGVNVWASSNYYPNILKPPLVIQSSNAGSNWNILASYSSSLRFHGSLLPSMFLLDSMKCFVGGYNGNILYTTDAGSTWQIDSVTSDDIRINSLYFYRDTIGYAVGSEGMILKKSFSASITEPERVFAHVRIYPTPVLNNADISFEIMKPAAIEVILYDLAGKKILMLYSSQKIVYGPQTVKLNSHSIRSGVYLLKIIAGEQVETKKIVIIRN